jgi:hypothetical protein
LIWDLDWRVLFDSQPLIILSTIPTVERSVISNYMQPNNYLLTVELSNELYASLLEKVQNTGKTESELVIQGLQQVLGLPESVPIAQQNPQYLDPDLFYVLEASLEKKLKEYVEKLLSDRILLSSSLTENTAEPRLEPNDRNLDIKPSMPMPTIRALQVGDRVLVLEPDSPYYMAKLLVVKTSLIRATVETETGEKTFLKRDLRFVETTK